MDKVKDKLEISEIIGQVGFFADSHKWDEIVKDCFDTKVLYDYESMGAGKPSEKTGEEIITMWKFLEGFDKTQHIAGSVFFEELNEKEAKTVTNVQAYHFLKNEEGKDDHWLVVGYYNHQLKKIEKKWKIVKLKFTCTLQGGNKKLPQLVMEKLKKK